MCLAVRAVGGRVALIPWVLQANKPDSISEPVYYKQILTYAVIVTLAGPLLVWVALVLPGWGS